MATTGISALGNDQIIAIAALSSKRAATAEQTPGGGGLQSLFDTVHDNSASWTGGGGGSYTGDAQGALDEVYTSSGTWNTVTGKLDTTAQVVTAVGTASVTTIFPYSVSYLVSSINGSAILPYGYSVLSNNSANWNSTYNTVHNNSGSWTGGGGGGVEYSGITPIVVNNTSHEISADTWGLAIGNGLSAVEDAVNKQTIISVTSQAGITDIVSATALPATPVSTVLYLIPEA